MQSIKNVLKNPLVWISIIYLLFPIDIVTDAIPVAGTVDDLLAMILAMLYLDYKARKKESENKNK